MAARRSWLLMTCERNRTLADVTLSPTAAPRPDSSCFVSSRRANHSPIAMLDIRGALQVVHVDYAVAALLLVATESRGEERPPPIAESSSTIGSELARRPVREAAYSLLRGYWGGRIAASVRVEEHGSTRAATHCSMPPGPESRVRCRVRFPANARARNTKAIIPTDGP